MTSMLALLLMVRVYHDPLLPARDVGAAARVASSVFAVTGVDVQWTFCTAGVAPARCQQPLQERELVVRLTPAPRSARNSDVIGFAYVNPRGSSVATIFVDRAVNLAAAAGQNDGIVIGHAVAHELGHLLLGSARHAPAGLMRARWTAAQIRRGVAADWMFSPAEAAALRRSVGARGTT